MKTLHTRFRKPSDRPSPSRLLAAAVILTLTASASGFDSGSDGSFGPINVTADTEIPLPPDGIIHATTIDITAGRTLTFTRNAKNTPVFLLATGDINLGGTINLNGAAAPTGADTAGGLAGPGGFDGGRGGNSSQNVAPGDGHGPGGGRAGENTDTADGAGGGSYSAQSTTGQSTGKGAIYGNHLLVPLLGGSGGGGRPDDGGHGGGGAILIASSTKIDMPSSSARVFANGGSAGGARNGGSGGAIRLIAPEISTGGSPILGVTGGSGGGAGRVRVDAITGNTSGFSVSPGPEAATFGTVLFTGLVLPYKVELTNVAGETITPSATAPVHITLPLDANTAQVVTVKLEGFKGVVPIEVVLTPDNGSRATFPAQVDMGDGSVAKQFAVNVTFPATNTRTRVDVWTR